MTSTRRTAIVAGVFYLLTEVTAIGGMLFYGSVSAHRSSSSRVGRRHRRAGWSVPRGACSPSLSWAPRSPCIRFSGRVNEGMALGYVAGRLDRGDDHRRWCDQPACRRHDADRTLPERPARTLLPGSPSASPWWRSTTGPSFSGRKLALGVKHAVGGVPDVPPPGWCPA
jgi:hypothetical protein